MKGHWLTVLSAASFLAACTPSEEEKRYIALVDHMEAFSELSTRHSGDCEAMGDAFESYMEEHGASIERQSAEVVRFGKGNAEFDEKMNNRYRVRIGDSMHALLSNTRNCKTVPKVSSQLIIFFKALNALGNQGSL